MSAAGGLVSYDSSSGSEDSSDNEASPSLMAKSAHEQIPGSGGGEKSASAVAAEVISFPAKPLSLALPPPTHCVQDDGAGVTAGEEERRGNPVRQSEPTSTTGRADTQDTPQLLLQLPPPSAAASRHVGEEGELEEFVLRRRPGPGTESPPHPPHPAPTHTKPSTILNTSKSRKGRIRIEAPSLADYDSDDSDNDSESKVISSTENKKGSGLFAILPEPKNVSVKESKRSLLPHSLTKKAASSSASGGGAKKTADAARVSVSGSNNGALRKTASHGKKMCDPSGSDSEEDDSGGGGGAADFFSLTVPAPQPTSGAVTTVTVADVAAARPRLTVCPPQPQPPPPPPSLTTAHGTTHHHDHRTPSHHVPSSQPPAPASAEDAPLQFKPTAAALHTQQRLHNQHHLQQQSVTNVQYSDYGPATGPYLPQHPAQPEDEERHGSAEYSADELRRLRGSSSIRRDGAWAGMDVVEVSADDALADRPPDWQVRSMAEGEGYRPKRRKGEGPSGQERRKHQITFLAFQAKEREMELKNQWASSRQTKQQTNAKYGF